MACVSELSEVLEQLATLSGPSLVAGDLNIHVERPSDPHACSLIELMSSHGLACRVNVSTHAQGGTLDVLFSRCDLPHISVNTNDPGLSDHHLLTWSMPFVTHPPKYVTSISRPWTRFDLPPFRQALNHSSLCHPSDWTDLSADELAELFDSCITAMLDKQIPRRRVTLRRRPLDPWFDATCREAKRHARHLEKHFRHLQHRLLSDPSLQVSADSAYRLSSF